MFAFDYLRKSAMNPASSWFCRCRTKEVSCVFASLEVCSYYSRERAPNFVLSFADTRTEVRSGDPYFCGEYGAAKPFVC